MKRFEFDRSLLAQGLVLWIAWGLFSPLPLPQKQARSEETPKHPETANVQTATAAEMVLRGDLYWIDGDSSAALEAFNQAIALDPEFADAYRSRARLLKRKGLLEKAMEDVNRVIALGPRKWTDFHARAELWAMKKAFPKAIADYSKAIVFAPEKAFQSYVNRGMVWWRLRQYEKALTDIDQAIQLDPKQAYAYMNKATVLESMGKKDEALKATEKAIEIEPTDGSAFCVKGRYFEEKSEYREALQWYRRAVRANPNDYWGYRNVARLLSSCEDDDIRDGKTAIKMATKACDLTDWKYSDVVETLAASYAEAGDFDKAVHWQQKAITLILDARSKNLAEQRLQMYKQGIPYRRKAGIEVIHTERTFEAEDPAE